MAADSFRVDIEQQTAGGVRVPVYVMHDSDGSARAEVWPANGFNCLRWQHRHAGGWGDALYTSPRWSEDPVPTRSGFPILFPFPNRIRDGRFTANGREYRLPLNDSTKQNAIHGFAPRMPWEVIASDATADSASVVGRFALSAANLAPRWEWPGEGTLTVKYTLERGLLGVRVIVENTGTTGLPFGLGFHPYFRLPWIGTDPIDGCTLDAPTSTIWELADSLPTGRTLPAPAELRFDGTEPIGTRAADAVYTNLGGVEPLFRLGKLSGGGGSLTISVSPEFRELVLFTPPHRQAVAIEPYTCATDAANLGVGAGWVVLPPGEFGFGEVRVGLEWPS